MWKYTTGDYAIALLFRLELDRFLTIYLLWYLLRCNRWILNYSEKNSTNFTLIQNFQEIKNQQQKTIKTSSSKTAKSTMFMEKR